MKNAIVKAAFELKSSYVGEKRSNTFFYIVILSLPDLVSMCKMQKSSRTYSKDTSL